MQTKIAFKELQAGDKFMTDVGGVVYVKDSGNNFYKRGVMKNKIFMDTIIPADQIVIWINQ